MELSVGAALRGRPSWAYAYPILLMQLLDVFQFCVYQNARCGLEIFERRRPVSTKLAKEFLASLSLGNRLIYGNSYFSTPLR